MNKYASEHFATKFLEKGEFPLRYREGMSPEERKTWKCALRSKVQELMAFSPDMYETPIVNLLIRKDRGSYFIEKYEISPEPDLWMTFLLLIPKTASEENKTPAVLCTPGTLGTKERLAGEDFQDLQYDPPQQRGGFSRYHFSNAMALHYVHHGFTALACEDLSVGEHKGEMVADDVEKFLNAQGRSMMGVTVEIRYAMMQWLKTLPWVDRSKLAVSGHSLGVDSLLHLVLLDEEITGFVHNDYISNWQELWINVYTTANNSDTKRYMFTAPWHRFPEMCRWYTYNDLLAAYAPRKLFITEGGKESNLLRLKQVYTDLAAEENFRYDFYPEYSDPSKRVHTDNPIRRGMTRAEYLDHINVNPEKHFFKYETAVPWLVEAMKK